MLWTGISIQTPTPETEDAVVQLLLNAGCAGVALKGDGASREVTSYIPTDDSSHARLRQIQAAVMLLPSLGIGETGAVVVTEIDEEDWANSWKAYFKPLRIGKRLVVSPPWEDPQLKSSELLITIDPGMAFGTGTHATTQLCMILLEEYLEEYDRAADIGTGSGILSIALKKLGAKSVTAVDNDPLAVKIASENSKINQVEVNISEHFPAGEQFDIVVANIIADTLIALADQLAAITVAGGILIVSGVIEGRENDVRLFTEAAGFTSLETRYQGEWTALAFRRTAV